MNKSLDSFEVFYYIYFFCGFRLNLTGSFMLLFSVGQGSLNLVESDSCLMSVQTLIDI